MANPQGLVNSNDSNKTAGRHIRNYSNFDADQLSYRLSNTLRFGDYTPSFVMEGVPGDEISLNSRDMIDSLSLATPFKSSIRKIKESFAVPNMAILPLNWDRIYTQPSNGDDVPKDANCVLRNFPYLFSTFWSDWYSKLKANMPSSSSNLAAVCGWLTAMFRVLILGEFIYSHGSLLNVLGYKASAQWSIQVGEDQLHSYDYWFDKVIKYCFNNNVVQFTVSEPVGSLTVTRYFAGNATANKPVALVSADMTHIESFRAMIELFRENPLCKITSIELISGDTIGGYGAYLGLMSASYPSSTYPLLGNVVFHLPNSAGATDDDLTDMSQTNLNLSRVLAYQLICAHFFSNSSIDFVYSAELYRQYITSLYFLAEGTSPSTTNPLKYVPFPQFVQNGVACQYDALSENVLRFILFYGHNWGNGSVTMYNFAYGVLAGTINNTDSFPACLSGFAAIFGYRKSLRYSDYFVGARPRALAPINTDVSVNSNLVSVVDITRSIQAQRFANSVMRSRQKIEDYVKSLFGKAPAPDYHNPFFLSRESDIVFGDDVQNTGAIQASDPNSRTSNFASNSGRFTFTFHNDDNHPCIYMQIISFDVKRSYTKSVDRQFFHLDRYDMFNPDFQYIGDQPVYGMELGYNPKGSAVIPDVISYQTRDMEYKQRFDVASGGFVENLPGWIFTDQDTSKMVAPVIGPDFIRSYNTELDRFFLSLTGYSLGNYFHFMCITDNSVSAKRQMAIDPQILQ